MSGSSGDPGEISATLPFSISSQNNIIYVKYGVYLISPKLPYEQHFLHIGRLFRHFAESSHSIGGSMVVKRSFRDDANSKGSLKQ